MDAAIARVLGGLQLARGATYLDVRVPERPAAGGLAPLHPETATPSTGEPWRTARSAVHDDPRTVQPATPACTPDLTLEG